MEEDKNIFRETVQRILMSRNERVFKDTGNLNFKFVGLHTLIYNPYNKT